MCSQDQVNTIQLSGKYCTLLSPYFIGNHTFAALNAHEDYEVISTGMEEIMNQINALIAKPQIKIDGVFYTLEIVLGGDYKVCSLSFNRSNTNCN